MGHSHFFKPPREAAIPPIMPPMVSAKIPTVPYTNPTSPVVNPNPPTSWASNKKGVINFRACASENRKVSIKKMAVPTPGLLKNETKVSEKSFRTEAADLCSRHIRIGYGQKHPMIKTKYNE